MADPIKVAVLGSLPPLRALSSYCLEFAKALSRQTPLCFLSFRKIYPAFLYPGGKLEEDRSFPAIDSPGLEVQRRLTWYNPFTWLKAALFTPAELLHAQWWSAPLLPIYLVILAGFRLRRKPVVITIHNVVSHEQSTWFSHFSGLLYRLGQHYIVHSQQNKQQLIDQHGIAEQKISIVPHGPLELFAGREQSREQARKQLALPPNSKIILLFGAIRPYKGVDTALQALARLKDRHPDYHLIIAGKLWGDWSLYQRLIDELGLEPLLSCHLDYIPTDSVGSYFQAADLVLLPYHHFDSQSGIGSAALAFAKPLIVSNTGGLPELVRNPDYIVPPRDADKLAQAIEKALNDPDALHQMALDAQAIREASSWSGIAEKTLSIYKQLLEKQ